MKCRLVYTAKDKCAFIQANCPDEEAGLLSYLRLYYCQLPHAQPLAFLLLVLWLALLFSTIGIAASDFLCINLSTIASILGMSESLTGVTFLAFGNGSPDVFSTFAAMSSNSGSLAVGELVGAAGFITAVVAGSMALVRPFQVARRSFVRDVGFFVIAASFSMVFLADGSLRFWECVSMVAFYVFYVIFVVIWHWYLGKRRKERIAETAARSHFHVPGHQELDMPQEDTYDEETPVASERTSLLAASREDFAALEGGITPTWKIEEVEDDDETRDRYLAELRNNMRVSRPVKGERRNTMTPIRPSLVGALEFRSILSSLERSRNIQTIPMNARRYSDGPTYTLSQQQDLPTDWEVQTAESSEGAAESRTSDNGGRIRAVSANDAAGLKLDTSVLKGTASSQVEGLSPVHPPTQNQETSHSSDANSKAQNSVPHSPTQTHLAVPNVGSNGPKYLASQGVEAHQEAPGKPSGSRLTPTIYIPPSPSPRLTDRSPLASPFPVYADEQQYVGRSRPPSIHLPPPSISPASVPESVYPGSQDLPEHLSHPLKWWPYKIMPAPQIILSALFPTAYALRGKSIWDMILGIVTAPSVFLLTITLPVVEPPEQHEAANPDPGLLSPPKTARSQTPGIVRLPEDSPNLISIDSSSDRGPTQPQKRPTPQMALTPAEPLTPDSTTTSPMAWNRWLVILQLFTAPFFLTLIIWANTNDPPSTRRLLYMTLISLLVSLILLFILLALTSPSRPPKYRPLFCFLGFSVAIAWISTIANEVVGVLKAIGVILDISDAILGLTIFAVGNSLGDLVADITVARLGFPVMALSACFGGPMLNILLGIGVGGMYMTLRGADAQRRKHPDRPIIYKPYEVEVSSTLLISGVTLLVTLLGLLVVVPWNGWRMDRRVGWGLIGLWTISTIGNVIVEVTGVGGSVS